MATENAFTIGLSYRKNAESTRQACLPAMTEAARRRKEKYRWHILPRDQQVREMILRTVAGFGETCTEEKINYAGKDHNVLTVSLPAIERLAAAEQGFLVLYKPGLTLNISMSNEYSRDDTTPYFGIAFRLSRSTAFLSPKR